MSTAEACVSPQDSPDLLLLLRLLALGQGAWDMIDSQVFKEPKMVTGSGGLLPAAFSGGCGVGSGEVARRTGRGAGPAQDSSRASAPGGGAGHQVPAHAHVLRGGRPHLQRGSETPRRGEGPGRVPEHAAREFHQVRAAGAGREGLPLGLPRG